jgi:hypothetical protein
MTVHGWMEGGRTVLSVVGSASILANILPPASTYDDYPRFKRFYETFIVKTIAAVSVSIRAQYPSLAVPMFGLKQPPAPSSAEVKKPEPPTSDGIPIFDPGSKFR